MIRIIRTDSLNEDFVVLVQQLDKYLAEKDGEEHSFYHQYNHITSLKNVVIAYNLDGPIGCGAIKEFDIQTMEVKRMFTNPTQRGQGIATQILNELEKWTLELGYNHCILETGKRQPEAIQLYKKSGYLQIPNYGQYKGMENSLCFKKRLTL